MYKPLTQMYNRKYYEPLASNLCLTQDVQNSTEINKQTNHFTRMDAITTHGILYTSMSHVLSLKKLKKLKLVTFYFFVLLLPRITKLTSVRQFV